MGELEVSEREARLQTEQAQLQAKRAEQRATEAEASIQKMRLAHDIREVGFDVEREVEEAALESPSPMRSSRERRSHGEGSSAISRQPARSTLKTAVGGAPLPIRKHSAQ